MLNDDNIYVYNKCAPQKQHSFHFFSYKSSLIIDRSITIVKLNTDTKSTHSSWCIHNKKMKSNLYTLLLLLIFVTSGVYQSPIVQNQDSDEYTKHDDKGELMLVQLLFRHGARTPFWVYNNDVYKDFFWPEGLGMLTDEGKALMYDYGLALNKRYHNYISKNKIYKKY